MGQIAALASAGCEIVRVAVPKNEDADALRKIVYLSPLPVIADIHFNALARAEGDRRGRRRGAHQPRQHRRPRQGRAGRQAPRRPRGSRCGSAPTPARCPKHLHRARPAGHRPRRSSRRRSSRSSCSSGSTTATSRSRSSRARVPTMIRAYRMLSEKVPYPLHLGVTEAGHAVRRGRSRARSGIGSLLMDGIGDTMRVSLTADPVEGGRGRLGDPQGARPARARPGDDRVPLVRARQRRRREPRRGRGGAARGTTRRRSRSR